MKTHARWLVGLAISIAALGLAVRGVNLDQLLGALESANYWYILPAIFCLFLSVVFRGFRWRLILGNKPSPLRTTSITAIGYLVNSILPLRAGEIVRAYLVSHPAPDSQPASAPPDLDAHHSPSITNYELRITQYASRSTSRVSGLEAMSSVAVERVLDVLGILLMLVVILPALPMDANLRSIVLAGSISVGGFAIVLLVGLVLGAFWPERVQAEVFQVARRLPWFRKAGRPERIRQATAQALEGLSVLADWRRLPGVLLWTALVYAAMIATEACLLWAFEPVTLVQTALVLIVTALGISVPSSPGQFGAYEAGAKLALLSLVVNRNGVLTPIGDSRAFAMALTLHAVNYLFLLGLGAVALTLEEDSFAGIVRSARGFAGSVHHPASLPAHPPRSDGRYSMHDISSPD